ncbi:MAG TPA: prepilin-type N-terminal cleavage/methylation domain-containing protein [Bryobacteraceae bacterium]|jgi:type II secretion system protein I|nr:prepilin-type N-terminal cleavage/methylation domain-containing protein [Bryobacteraceae bacterium]
MKRSKSAGFTLLELLIATVIMATAVTGLLSALSTSTRNAARVTEHDRATLLADRKMSELLSTTTRLPRFTPLEGGWDATQSGGVPMKWRAIVTPFELPPSPAPGQYVLDRIQLEISWLQGDRERHFSVEAFRRSTLTQQDIEAGVLRQPQR